jgi:hypothetical protein
MGTPPYQLPLGGIVNMDGRYVRLIVYTGGSGIVPVSILIISKAVHPLLAVWSSPYSSANSFRGRDAYHGF